MLMCFCLQVQYEGGRKHYKRLQNLIKNPLKQSAKFYNEFQRYAYCARQPNEPLKAWQMRQTCHIFTLNRALWCTLWSSKRTMLAVILIRMTVFWFCFRSVFEACVWYFDHLIGKIPLVMLTTDEGVRAIFKHNSML